MRYEIAWLKQRAPDLAPLLGFLEANYGASAKISGKDLLNLIACALVHPEVFSSSAIKGAELEDVFAAIYDDAEEGDRDAESKTIQKRLYQLSAARRQAASIKRQLARLNKPNKTARFTLPIQYTATNLGDTLVKIEAEYRGHTIAYTTLDPLLRFFAKNGKMPSPVKDCAVDGHPIPPETMKAIVGAIVEGADDPLLAALV